ncbi:phage head closure protein [Massilia rhizosphaerae]|uniref:phage head closure protein n=1 Tax=Massilia rhizosphaerae TaxID=2784389 RepID=UPI0018DE0487|nr:phage head closure protein [Massilia rhizosphaerae]
MIAYDTFVLDKRVILQERSSARDALNKPVDAWVNVLPGDGTTWASITDQTGHQYMAAGGTQNAVQTQIKIRRRAGVIPSMRVLHGQVPYDIQAVLERDRTWMILMCTKGVSNG